MLRENGKRRANLRKTDLSILFRVRTVHYFVVNLRRHIFGVVLLYPYILSVLRNNILY